MTGCAVLISRRAGLVALSAYAGTILAANFASSGWPDLHVVELHVPAGAMCAGLAWTARDFAQDVLGWRGVLVAIVLGTGLSWLVASPRIASASAVAFAASELVDFTVYAALGSRSQQLAVAGSNTAGLLVDSALFAPLALGTWAAVPGQIAGKTASTVLAVVVLAVRSRCRAQP